MVINDFIYFYTSIIATEALSISVSVDLKTGFSGVKKKETTE